jgi:DNA-binding beta-propeller fold protein YncE
MRVHWMRLAVIVIALSLVAGCTSAGPAPTSVPTLQPVPAVVPTLQPAPIAVPTLQPTPTTSAAAIPLEFVSKITGGPNPFDGPFGLALDQQGNLYVVDTGNSRILKFDSTGKFLLEWGSQGSADGQFNFPHGPYGGSVAVDAQGNVYVADSVNDRIQKFDSNGQFLTKWGKSGTGDGEFADPFGVAVDRLSNVYVIDDDNPRIQKFDSNG